MVIKNSGMNQPLAKPLGTAAIVEATTFGSIMGLLISLENAVVADTANTDAKNRFFIIFSITRTLS